MARTKKAVKWVRLAFNVAPEDHKRLIKMSKARGISQSEMIREFINSDFNSK